MAQAHTIRTERLEARLTAEQKEKIEEAAAIRGISVSDFVITSAQEAASRLIRENEVLTLSERDRKTFFDLLLNPPKPNKRALAAAKRVKREIAS
jgi:uncharacterized protein (DUF1778 family)